MSKGKRLVLALVLLVTFCTVAIAASPKVDSILQEHDVLVPFFLPRTLFTITPQGDDVTWSISRKNGDEWEDATVSWDQSTPLQGEIGADDGQQRIWWNFKNYGDNTGHDGGVTHRLDVKVNGKTVTQVDFDVTYVPEAGAGLHFPARLEDGRGLEGSAVRVVQQGGGLLVRPAVQGGLRRADGRVVPLFCR